MYINSCEEPITGCKFILNDCIHFFAETTFSPPKIQKPTLFSELSFHYRAVQLHQKLSSPLRKRPPDQYSIKILEEKQAKAQLFRNRKQEELVQKSKNISDKVCHMILT